MIRRIIKTQLHIRIEYLLECNGRHNFIIVLIDCKYIIIEFNVLVICNAWGDAKDQGDRIGRSKNPPLPYV